MNKLVSFENFIGHKTAQAAAVVREEQEEKRSSSANSFKALLAEYGVAAVAELTEDQRTEFFAKLRGAEVNESTFCASLEALNEAIKVSSKREANKVWNVYTKIFNEATALTTDKETHIGAIREIFWRAMEDANFSREANAIMRLLKAPNRFKSFNVNVPELGNTAIQIGHSTINTYLDTVYGRISSAGKWGGITIVEGTALYLESIGMASTGQALIDDFNRQFNESVVTESDEPKCSNKKGHLYKQVDKDGTVECEHCGLRNSLSESAVNEAEIKSDEEFKEYAFSVLKKAFGEDFDEAKATEVVDGILGKTKGDYAKAAGMLQSSLG
jgi:hypothetical protein